MSTKTKEHCVHCGDPLEEGQIGLCDDCQPTYKIVRMYFKDSSMNRTIKTGLTLAEAQAHCKDPETTSSKCTKRENVQRTERCGPWFDGYEKE